MVLRFGAAGRNVSQSVQLSRSGYTTQMEGAGCSCAGDFTNRRFPYIVAALMLYDTTMVGIAH